MILKPMFIDYKTRILKFIDHWVGGPICIFWALLNRVIHPFYHTFLKANIDKPPRSILIIKFFGLGSIILSSALVKAIREKYPGARVVFFTFKDNAVLLKSLDLGIDIKTIDVGSPLALITSILQHLLYFSFHKPDISIDLEFYSKFSTMMSYFSGAPWRVGFYIARFWRNSLVNVPVYFNYARHILEIYSMVGAAVGVELKDVLPVKMNIPEDDGIVDNILPGSSIREGDFVLGININASDLAYCRRWPLERFAEVINELLRKKDDLVIILTGSKNETSYTASIMELVDGGERSRVINLAGKLSFMQFAALLRHMDLFLTNDSGPFHIAAAQQVPTVSIWGPGSPDLYGPYGREKERHAVVYKRLPCSPCLYIYRTDAGYFCKGAVSCLYGIRSSDVVDAVNDMMGRCTKKY